jgi:hypothetical protein
MIQVRLPWGHGFDSPTGFGIQACFGLLVA